jgi:hypothetical protein
MLALGAECQIPSTRQSNLKKNKMLLNSLPSVRFVALGKEIKKNDENPLPSARSWALGKVIKKNKTLKILCRVPDREHSTKNFKKNKRLCRVPDRRHSAKQFF